MKTSLLTLTGLTGMTLLAACHRLPDPPAAKEIPAEVTIEGKSFRDPFTWMETTGDSSFLTYINAENEYCDSWFKGAAGLKQTLLKELTATRISDLPADEPKLLPQELICKRFVILIERRSLAPTVRIVDIKARAAADRENRINFTDPDGNITYEGYDSIRGKILMRYSSILTPPSLYAYDPVSRKLMIRWQKKVPGYNKDDYAAKLLRVDSRDGKKILMTILYKQGLENQDGSNPLLLIAAGTDSLSKVDKFNPDYLSLLDRGFYVAKAYIRGSGETGRVWRDEGSGAKKDNRWNDFLDCAWFLTREHFTSDGMITAQGEGDAASAILVAMRYQPQLFRAAILEDPGAGLLTWPPDRYLQHKNYPPMFFLTSMEGLKSSKALPARMVAGLRKIKTGEGILLLRSYPEKTVSEAGEPDPQCLRQAEMWAFVLEQYGIEK